MTPQVRRRSASTHRAILDATRELLLDVGYDRLSIEGIAARAGVGKQTVYRWWSSKASVVAESVVAGGIVPDDGPIRDSGDIAADLRIWLRNRARGFATPEHASLIRALTSAAASDLSDAQRLYDHVTGPHQAAIVGRLRRGVEAGRVRTEADLEAAADALTGALLFQLLAGNEIVSVQRADALLNLLLPGLLTAPP